MKRIESFVGSAPKISKTGNIEYTIWIDRHGCLYVQISNNERTGTFSGLLFSVSEILHIRDSQTEESGISGYDPNDRIKRVSTNNNDGAFLKAILKHLIPEN